LSTTFSPQSLVTNSLTGIRNFCTSVRVLRGAGLPVQVVGTQMCGPGVGTCAALRVQGGRRLNFLRGGHGMIRSSLQVN